MDTGGIGESKKKRTRRSLGKSKVKITLQVDSKNADINSKNSEALLDISTKQTETFSNVAHVEEQIPMEQNEEDVVTNVYSNNSDDMKSKNFEPLLASTEGTVTSSNVANITEQIPMEQDEQDVVMTVEYESDTMVTNIGTDGNVGERSCGQDSDKHGNKSIIDDNDVETASSRRNRRRRNKKNKNACVDEKLDTSKEVHKLIPLPVTSNNADHMKSKNSEALIAVSTEKTVNFLNVANIKEPIPVKQHEDDVVFIKDDNDVETTSSRKSRHRRNKNNKNACVEDDTLNTYKDENIQKKGSKPLKDGDKNKRNNNKEQLDHKQSGKNRKIKFIPFDMKTVSTVADAGVWDVESTHENRNKFMDNTKNSNNWRWPCCERYNEMIYTQIEGDLFDAPNDYSLAHCVAEDLHMGAGIAVEFKKRFKGVGILQNQRKSVGEAAVLTNENRFIFYLITKKKSSGKPTLESLQKSLENMRTYCKENNITKLAIPQIGCGLDRLDWDCVKDVLISTFKDCDMEINVYKPMNTKHNRQVRIERGTIDSRSGVDAYNSSVSFPGNKNRPYDSRCDSDERGKNEIETSNIEERYRPKFSNRNRFDSDDHERSNFRQSSFRTACDRSYCYPGNNNSGKKDEHYNENEESRRDRNKDGRSFGEKSSEFTSNNDERTFSHRTDKISYDENRKNHHQWNVGRNDRGYNNSGKKDEHYNENEESRRDFSRNKDRRSFGEESSEFTSNNDERTFSHRTDKIPYDENRRNHRRWNVAGNDERYRNNCNRNESPYERPNYDNYADRQRHYEREEHWDSG